MTIQTPAPDSADQAAPLDALLADADKPAPAEPGGGGLRPLAAAPGTYVFDT
jgi:hypothetical protein